MNTQDKLLDFVNDPENIKRAAEGSMEKRLKVMKPVNQDIEQILDSHLNEIKAGHDSNLAEALAQRETQLIEYIADLYGLPADELKRNVELWRGK